MDKVRFGIAGIGNMGSSHVKRLLDGSVPNAELTAVCDVKPARLEWAKTVCPETVQYFTDSHEMITSGLCDAIFIATPHYFHPTIAIDAFENGLNVLSEKPIGVYTKAIYPEMEAAKKSGKAFCIMYNQRTDRYYRKIREMVQSGMLGELKRCIWIVTDWYRTQEYYSSGGWRATWAGEGGGVLLNQSPHNIDLWQWIFGMPSKIFASCDFGKYHDIEVEDDVTAIAKYPNGATGVFVTTTGEYPGTNRLEISGSKGKIVYERGKFQFFKLNKDERENTFATGVGYDGGISYEVEDIVVDGPDINQHTEIVKNFVNNILYGEELISPGYDGIKMLSISNAMMLSAWENKWVDIPNDGEEFLAHLTELQKTSRHKEDLGVILSVEGSFHESTK